MTKLHYGLKSMISEIKTEVKGEERLTRREVKAENTATSGGRREPKRPAPDNQYPARSQFRHPWMQQVISFVSKQL